MIYTAKILNMLLDTPEHHGRPGSTPGGRTRTINRTNTKGRERK